MQKQPNMEAIMNQKQEYFAQNKTKKQCFAKKLVIINLMEHVLYKANVMLQWRLKLWNETSSVSRKVNSNYIFFYLANKEWTRDENQLKYLNIRMKLDKTEAQHLSISSMIKTTGVHSICPQYHDARMDISASYSINTKVRNSKV